MYMIHKFIVLHH